MPTYHSPSSSPSRSVSRSSSLSDTPRRRRNTSTRSRSRRRSPSPSSSRSSTRSSSRSNRASTALKKATSSDTKTESVVKTSLVFLGAVGAATLAAHKFWPKGVTYGEKEEWETKQERKVRKAMREEEEDGDGGKRGAGDDRSSTASGSRGGRDRDEPGGREGGRDRDRQRERERDGSRDRDSRMREGDWERRRQRERVDERDTGRRGVSVGGGYYKREEIIVRGKERAPDRPRSVVREHPREQDGAYVEREQRIDRYITSGRDRDRLDVPVASTVVGDRRRSTGRDADYYPPTQQRYSTTEPARSTAGTDRPRSSRYYDDRDDEADVVYVRREPAVRGRAYSEAVPVDAGRPRSRYDDEYYR